MLSRRFLFEADDDDEAQQDSDFANANGGDNNTADDNTGNDDNAGDDNADNNTEDTADNTGDDNKDDQNTDQDNNQDNGDDNKDNTDNDDDFTINTDDDNASGDDTNNTDDQSSDTSSGDSGSEESVDTGVKAKERELFDSLSPEEQQMKNKMLKKLFGNLYSNCESVIDKLNGLGAGLEEVDRQIKRSLSILFELKQMVSDYLLNMYDSKTYIENDIMFNRYLSVLNAIKNITNDIDSIYQDDTSTKDNENA
jgi:hypothetical protein